MKVLSDGYNVMCHIGFVVHIGIDPDPLIQNECYFVILYFPRSLKKCDNNAKIHHI